MIYSATFPLPRLAQGIFPMSLKLVFKEIYDRDLDIIEYGKPSRNTFNFTERHLKSQFGEIHKFYMIGDNPAGDIRGANEAGWESVLVWTGLFSGVNDEMDPAKIVVNDVSEAVREILRREGM